MTTTKLTTAEQFGEIHQDGHFDLIDGEVYHLSPSKNWHATVGGRIQFELALYGHTNNSGESPISDGGFQVAHDPDSVLCPDASFVATEKIQRAAGNQRDWYPFAPDIAVEVLSPYESRRLVARKIELYLAAGSAQVWVVDVRRETLTVHTRDAEPRVYKRGDTLDGGEALPGFTLEIARIFR